MLSRFLCYPFANAMARALISGIQTGDSLLGELENRSSANIRKDLFPGENRQMPPLIFRLHQDFQKMGERIASALPDTSGILVRTYLERSDIDTLKLICRNVLREKDQVPASSVVLPRPRRSRLPATVLAETRSLEEVLARMPRGTLRDILRRSFDVDPDRRLYSLETSLDRYFWEKIRAAADGLSSFDRAAALEILGYRADIDRLGIISRGLRAGLEEEAILSALPPMGDAFPPSDLRRTFRTPDPVVALVRLYPLRGVDKPFGRDGELGLVRRLRQMLAKVMRGHPFDLSLPLAAILLKELQIRDAQVILSGLLLGVEPVEIRSLAGLTGS